MHKHITAKSTNSGLKNPVNTSRVAEVFHVPTVVQLQTYSHISRHAPRRPDMICVCWCAAVALARLAVLMYHFSLAAAKYERVVAAV